MNGDDDDREVLEQPCLRFTYSNVDGVRKPRIRYSCGVDSLDSGATYVESKGGTVEEFPGLKQLGDYLKAYAKETWGYENYHISANEAAFLQLYFTLDFDKPRYYPGKAFNDTKKLFEITEKLFAQMDLLNGRAVTPEVRQRLKQKLGSPVHPMKLIGKELAPKQNIDDELKPEDVLLTEEEAEFFESQFKPVGDKAFPDFYPTLNQLGFYGVRTLNNAESRSAELSRLLNKLNAPSFHITADDSTVTKIRKEFANLVEKMLREDDLLDLSFPSFKQVLASNSKFSEHFVPKDPGTNWSAVFAMVGWATSAVLAAKMAFDRFLRREKSGFDVYCSSKVKE